VAAPRPGHFPPFKGLPPSTFTRYKDGLRDFSGLPFCVRLADAFCSRLVFPPRLLMSTVQKQPSCGARPSPLFFPGPIFPRLSSNPASSRRFPVFFITPGRVWRGSCTIAGLPSVFSFFFDFFGHQGCSMIFIPATPRS